MSGYRNGVGPRWWRAFGPELQEGCLTFQLPINVAHRMQINYEVIKPEAITLSTKLTVWNGNPQARHQRAANRKPWSVTKAKATLQMRSPSGRDRGGFHVHLARMPCTDCVLWMKNFGLRTGIGIGIGFFLGGGGRFVYVANKQSTKSQRWQGVACYAGSGSPYSSVLCSISCSHPHVRQPSTEAHWKKLEWSRKN